jgi:hypothetical protein
VSPPDPARGRLIVRGLGVTGVGVGAILLAAPRLAMRLFGLEATGKAVPILTGLFAGRDIALGIGLLSVATDPEVDRRWLRVTAGTQISDIVVALRLARRGDVSRRGAAGIVLSATATLGATVIADRDLRLR